MGVVGGLQFVCSSPVNPQFIDILHGIEEISPSHWTPLGLSSRTSCRVSTSEGDCCVLRVECICKLVLGHVYT